VFEEFQARCTSLTLTSRLLHLDKVSQLQRTAAAFPMYICTTTSVALTLPALQSSTNWFQTGGAVLGDIRSRIEVIGSTFIDNSASYAFFGGATNSASLAIGGAISADNISIDSSVFIRNTALVSGGAVHARSAIADLTITNSIYVNNSSPNSGGALFQAA
jgi:predicted outer membrane repeat protein